jgi:hypothetical protein
MDKNQRNENERTSEQDQLRGNTMNETIRNVGNMDEKNETLRDAEQGSGRSYDYGTEGSDMSDTSRRNSDAGQQNASASRGGTSDMDDESIAGAGRDTRTQRGSGLTTKRSITGSDFDGQNSTD